MGLFHGKCTCGAARGTLTAKPRRYRDEGVEGDDQETSDGGPCTSSAADLLEGNDGFRAYHRPFVLRRTRVPARESVRHLLKLHIQSQLRFSGPRAATKLPRGANREMWIDIYVVDFVNEVASMWSLVEENCSCQCGRLQMSAGARRSYDWEGTHICAVDYARSTLAAAKEAIEDGELFPEDERDAHPPQFIPTVRMIIRRLVHIYAHVFHAHFSAVVALRCDHVVNSLFKRFVLFVIEFDLVDRYEFEPLDELIRNLIQPKTASPRQQPTRITEHVDSPAVAGSSSSS